MTQLEEETIRIEKTFAAAPGRVRQAWTDPDQLAKWFAPPGMGIDVRTADVRPGGQYEITMKGDDGAYTCTGTYQEVTDDKLVFSWNWTGEGAMPNDTTVTVRFLPDGKGTRLVLEHTGLPNADAAAHHTEGWNGCLANLEILLG